jgi:hypothetical protein
MPSESMPRTSAADRIGGTSLLMKLNPLTLADIRSLIFLHH